MDVHQAVLAASAFTKEDFPTGCRPEVAFLGRSNVGKSSLINYLVGRKDLARTSSTPGKTRGLFFYLINDAFYLVDLPGYGYAKVSQSTRRSWAPLIDSYLQTRQVMCGCVHLVDVRHPPTGDDLLMKQWLNHYRVPQVTVATKADKLSRGALINRLNLLRSELKLPVGEPLLAFSAIKGIGKNELWAEIDRMLFGANG
ncbi:MAG TPA: YihA family ribosome biogenesis GTP-binding protein [Firmicutes bacterium]|nr:YihA family ribosome biogenesis GTP-binding protein [Bacillota bacterium]